MSYFKERMNDLKENEGNPSQSPKEVLTKAIEEAQASNWDLSVLLIEATHEISGYSQVRIRKGITILARNSQAEVTNKQYVILPRVNLHTALKTAGQLLEDIPPEAPEGSELGLSIGVTTFDRTRQETAGSLDLKARLGLSEAKKIGINKIGVVLNSGQQLSLDDLSPSLRDNVVLIPT